MIATNKVRRYVLAGPAHYQDNRAAPPDIDPMTWLMESRAAILDAAQDWVVRSRLQIPHRVYPLLTPLPPMVMPPPPVGPPPH